MFITPQQFNEFLKSTGEEILNTLRIEAQARSFNYGGGLPVPGKLTLRSGNLLRLLMGTGARERGGSIADIVPITNGIKISWGAESPYIALHEVGGFRPITPLMRKFYWAKYFTDPARRQMWKVLALFKDTIMYPPRPVLQPAVDSSEPKIKGLVEKFLGDIIKFHKQLILAEIKK